MFTWICPQCGREVPPSATECPDCAERGRSRTPDRPPPPEFPPAAAVEAPAKPPKAGARAAGRMPGWLLALFFAVGFLALGTGGFFAYTRLSSGGAPPATRVRPPEQPGQSKAAASATPLADVLLEYIEVTGLRLVEDNPKQLKVRFVIVNHSQAPLTDLAGVVTLRPTTAKPDTGEAVGSFAFRLPELAPLEVKDMTAPLQSKLRVYELPDWEFMRADLKITKP